MRILALSLLASAALGPTITPPRLTAQTRDSAAVGARVRVFGPTVGAITGPLYGLTPDTITIDLTRVPWSAVSRAEISVKRHAHTFGGAVLGLLVGAGFAVYKANYTTYSDPGAGSVFAIYTLIVGLPAMGLGAVVGGNIRGDDWRELPRPGRAPPPELPPATGGGVRRPVPDSLR